MIEFAKRKSYQVNAVTHDENFSLQSFVKDDWKLSKGMEKADKIVLTEYKNLLTNTDWQMFCIRNFSAALERIASFPLNPTTNIFFFHLTLPYQSH